MVTPEGFTPSAACDADTRCGRTPCFQVQLEASQPQQADWQALACAHHVADVIEALRAWAAEHGVADGALTILAIEPTAGGPQPHEESRSDLRGFAFSRIPLGSGARPGPQAGVASRATLSP